MAGLVQVDPQPDPTPQPSALELSRDALQADATAAWIATYDAASKFWDWAWADSGVYSTVDPETQERAGTYNPGLTCEKIATLHADDFIMLLTFVGALKSTAAKAGASQARIDRLNQISGPPDGWTAAEGLDGFMVATPPHEQA